MGRPLNMNPEEYARDIVADQQDYIKELEAELGDDTGVVLEYSFSASNSEPPGSGQLRLDAPAASATKAWPHKLTKAGTDASNAFTKLVMGDRVYVQDKNDASAYGWYTLSADPIVNNNYFELPLTLVSAGTGALKGGQLTLLSLLRA